MPINEKPCIKHKIAFPSWKMAEVVGMIGHGVYFKKCKKCNWVITTLEKPKDSVIIMS